MSPTDSQIDKLLSVPIPGGSQARDWFLPHEDPRGLNNVRDVVRLMFERMQQQAAQDDQSRASGHSVLIPSSELKSMQSKIAQYETTLSHLELRMARVYMEVTGGKCSKDTPASSVIALYGEHLNERIKEALKEHTAEVLNGVLLELQLLESGSAPFFNSIGQAIEVVKSMRDRK